MDGRSRKEQIMSRMGDYVIVIGELYQKRHPEKSWEQVMNEICFEEETVEIQELSDKAYTMITGKEL
jgi:hypothetical protein